MHSLSFELELSSGNGYIINLERYKLSSFCYFLEVRYSDTLTLLYLSFTLSKDYCFLCLFDPAPPPHGSEILPFSFNLSFSPTTLFFF